ncbi:MAG: hypothetical protein ACRDZ4_18985 [Egibacteraceae bacterium]
MAKVESLLERQPVAGAMRHPDGLGPAPPAREARLEVETLVGAVE